MSSYLEYLTIGHSPILRYDITQFMFSFLLLSDVSAQRHTCVKLVSCDWSLRSLWCLIIKREIKLVYEDAVKGIW